MKYGDKVRFNMSYNGVKCWYKAIYIGSVENNGIELFVQFPDGFRTNMTTYKTEFIKEGWQDNENEEVK